MITFPDMYQLFGRFALYEQMEESPFWETYKGKALGGTETEVKLVVLRRFLELDSKSEDSRLRFEREVQISAQVDTPAFEKVLDSGWRDGFPFVVSELVPGAAFTRILTLLGEPLSPGLACEFVRQLAQALIHANNLRNAASGQEKHLGINIRSCVLSFSGEVKVTGHYLPLVNNLLPKEARIPAAPECLETPEVSEASEVYALALILYQLLVGKCLLVKGREQGYFRILQTGLPPIEKIIPGLPAKLCSALYSALQRAPQKRTQSLAEWQTQIKQFAQPQSQTDLGKFCVSRFQEDFHAYKYLESLAKGAHSRERDSDPSKNETLPVIPMTPLREEHIELRADKNSDPSLKIERPGNELKPVPAAAAPVKLSYPVPRPSQSQSIGLRASSKQRPSSILRLGFQASAAGAILGTIFLGVVFFRSIDSFTDNGRQGAAMHASRVTGAQAEAASTCATFDEIGTGARLVAKPCESSNKQLLSFFFVMRKNGLYTIHPHKENGFCLDANGQVTEGGAQAVLAPCKDDPGQFWMISPNFDGAYNLVNSGTQRSLRFPAQSESNYMLLADASLPPGRFLLRDFEPKPEADEFEVPPSTLLRAGQELGFGSMNLRLSMQKNGDLVLRGPNGVLWTASSLPKLSNMGPNIIHDCNGCSAAFLAKGSITLVDPHFDGNRFHIYWATPYNPRQGVHFFISPHAPFVYFKINGVKAWP